MYSGLFWIMNSVENNIILYDMNVEVNLECMCLMTGIPITVSTREVKVTIIMLRQ